jgi:hypothetical protein
MHLRLLVLGLLLFSSPALAQDELLPGHSNIDLMWACQGRGDVYTVASEKNEDAEFFGQFDVLECVAYLAGMVDMNSMVQGFGGRGFFCIPERGISGEQQIRVFIKWAEAHPELLHESRRSGVIGAFVAAFPCK